MNLNEAFRFQNVISGMYNDASMLLRMDCNITKTTQVHNRKAANPEAEDETVEVISEQKSKISADDLIKFMVAMVEEKSKLAAAIAKAKAGLDINIDMECALNSMRREAAGKLKLLCGKEDKERRITGRDYKFNINGEQVPYTYFVDEKVEIAFNKEEARKLMRELADKADEVSKRLDMAEVNTEVEYEAPFSANDGFEDAVKAVLGKAE